MVFRIEAGKKMKIQYRKSKK